MGLYLKISIKLNITSYDEKNGFIAVAPTIYSLQDTTNW